MDMCPNLNGRDNCTIQRMTQVNANVNQTQPLNHYKCHRNEQSFKIVGYHYE